MLRRFWAGYCRLSLSCPWHASLAAHKLCIERGLPPLYSWGIGFVVGARTPSGHLPLMAGPRQRVDFVPATQRHTLAGFLAIPARCRRQVNTGSGTASVSVSGVSAGAVLRLL